MNEKFLKARIPADLYADLLARSGAAGKRLGTFVRDVLQEHTQAVSTSEALARIEAAVSSAQASCSAPAPAPVRRQPRTKPPRPQMCRSAARRPACALSQLLWLKLSVGRLPLLSSCFSFSDATASHVCAAIPAPPPMTADKSRSYPAPADAPFPSHPAARPL